MIFMAGFGQHISGKTPHYIGHSSTINLHGNKDKLQTVTSSSEIWKEFFKELSVLYCCLSVAWCFFLQFSALLHRYLACLIFSRYSCSSSFGNLSKSACCEIPLEHIEFRVSRYDVSVGVTPENGLFQRNTTTHMVCMKNTFPVLSFKYGHVSPKNIIIFSLVFSLKHFSQRTAMAEEKTHDHSKYYCVVSWNAFLYFISM